MKTKHNRSSNFCKQKCSSKFHKIQGDKNFKHSELIYNHTSTAQINLLLVGFIYLSVLYARAQLFKANDVVS